jgi:hypothetical protein
MNPQKTQTTEELLDDLAALLSKQSAERRELVFSASESSGILEPESAQEDADRSSEKLTRRGEEDP